ncbi:polysaccharide biosynthesis protein [Flavobacterium orientale]|uniref:polysaccharide biosynthesis protein n=1 Tax=Flavobacterium orientale TaxID=1756020 RepID=UPI0027E4A3C1|nr:nucleoside-diphosphate sugar epimerase/dehydratase [Flavobacterium orientale]
MKKSHSKYYKQEIQTFFADLNPGFKLVNMGYLPRWIVLLIDVLILVLSALITYLFLSNLTMKFYTTLSWEMRNFLMIIVNIFFFSIFKTYAGIIRHSTFIDGIKLFLSTFSAFISLLVINYSSYFIFGNKIFLVPGLFFNFILNFSLLFLFRILVKSVFERYLSVKNKERLMPALIYGTDANAIAVANALKLEVPSRFKLLGFISQDNKVSSKTILDLPLIQKNKRVPVILRMHRAQALILADNNLTVEEKRIIVDDCLENGYKVFTVPIISDWENKKEISRKVQSIKIEDLLERKPIVLDKTKVEQQLKGKRVMVTGAAGSIGSEIARQLLDFNPSELILLDQAETPLHNLFLELEHYNPTVTLHAVIQDVRNFAAMEKVFEKYKPNKVYHAAAYKHVPLMEQNPDQAVLVNVMGTKNVADLSYRYNVEKFVMVSTDKAVNPSNVMGASKRIAEKYVQSLYLGQKDIIDTETTKFITTRFGNVLGSNGSVVPLFSKQIEAGGPVTITHPDIIRYFMTIPEACQLVLEAGAMGNGGEIYLFDMGKPVKIIDLAKKMIRMAGFEPEKEIPIVVTGLRPGEKLFEELLNNSSLTLPTHHEKILVAKETFEDFKQLSKEIDDLIQLAHTENYNNIVSHMKQIVPEFKSNNSHYQKLDL